MAKKNPLLDFFTGLHGVTLVEKSIATEDVAVDYLIHFQNKNRVAVFLIDKAPEGGAVELRLRAQSLTLNGIYCLFLVHYGIMPNVGLSSVPDWLLGLHAMYYGRVYVYRPDTSPLFGAAHFAWFGDYDRRRVSYHNNSDSFLKLSLKSVACTSQHMPGSFLIGQFNDGVWWKNRQEWSHTEEPKRQRQRAEEPKGGPYNGFRTWEEYLEHVFSHYGYDPTGRARSNRTRPTSTSSRAEAYAVLGISTSASKEEIRKAYRELARRWHPDVCKEPNATEMMQQINAAYDLIK